MMYLSQIGRADLAILLYFSENDQHNSVYAELLGFESTIKEKAPDTEVSTTVSTRLNTKGQREVTVPVPSTIGQKPGIEFWHIASGEFFNVDENEKTPEWYSAAQNQLLTYQEIMDRYASRVPIELLPLIPWSRLWPVIRKTVGRSALSDTIDVEKLSLETAQCKPLRRLPRRKKVRWPHSIHLLIDRSERLCPFFSDMEMVAEKLEHLCGRHRLKKFVFPFGVSKGTFADSSDVFSEYKNSEQDVAVIALSDLGFLNSDSDSNDVEYWISLGKTIRSNGNSAFALVPCPRNRWYAYKSIQWDAICWDLGQRAIVKAGNRKEASCIFNDDITQEESDEKNRENLKFRILMSMIVRPDPDLLRHIRALLPVTTTDVGMESDFWMEKYECKALQTQFSETFPLAVRRELVDLLKLYHSAFIDSYCEEMQNLLLHDKELIGYINSAEINTFMTRYAATLENNNWKTTGLDGEFLSRFSRLENRISPEAWSDIHCAVAWIMKHRTDDLRLDTDIIPANLPLQDIKWALSRGWKNYYSLCMQGSKLFAKMATEIVENDTAINVSDCEIGSILTNTDSIWISENLELPHSGRKQFVLNATRASSLILNNKSKQFTVESSYAKYNVRQLTLPSWAEEIGRDEYGLYIDIKIENIKQRMRWINPGRFMMGSPQSEKGRYKNENQYEVILTNGYWLFDTPVTQALWTVVMRKNPSYFKSPDRPVEMVSWEVCQEFIRRINKLKPGLELMLPTEAEWEYVCRAGTSTAFAFGEIVSTSQINYDGNYPYFGCRISNFRQETVDVKTFPPNAWGIYEMHGNVWEWCNDRYSDYPTGTITDPRGPENGFNRILRGGSWRSDAVDCRSACRASSDAGNCNNTIGFRLSRYQLDLCARHCKVNEAVMHDAAVIVPELLLYKWHKNHGVDDFGIWLEFAYKNAIQRMRWIKPGRFIMGSPIDEPERINDEMQHEVIITKGYWLADTACTQAMWEAVTKKNPSHFKGPMSPVENVSWNDCMNFLQKINAIPDLNGISLCLPTEAQWEYACRAGTETPFSLGENVSTDQINYNGNYPYAGGTNGTYRQKTVDVKTLPPNAWGLYEMHGNVWEWCNDWHGDYHYVTTTDPTGQEKGDTRILRGGSWSNIAMLCRSAYRNYYFPGDRSDLLGFRLSRDQQEHGAKRGGAIGGDSRNGAKAVRHDAMVVEGKKGLFGFGRKRK